MFAIFGILGIILVIVGQYLLSAYVNLSVLGLTFFVVIPAGAILIGMFLGWMLSVGVKKSRKKFNKYFYLIAAIIGFVTFFGISYTEYATMYMADDNTINQKFEGTPISKLVYDDNGKDVPLTYINYVKYTLDNSESTISFKDHIK